VPRACMPPSILRGQEWAHDALMATMVGLGALSSVGSAGVRIGVEVQAVAALGGGDAATLARMNAGEREGEG
jgi:hypothetical protein